MFFSTNIVEILLKLGYIHEKQFKYLDKQIVYQVRVDITIAIYLHSNFRGYFGSQGFIIVPSIYLLTEMVCISMLMSWAFFAGFSYGFRES